MTYTIMGTKKETLIERNYNNRWPHVRCSFGAYAFRDASMRQVSHGRMRAPMGRHTDCWAKNLEKSRNDSTRYTFDIENAQREPSDQ